MLPLTSESVELLDHYLCLERPPLWPCLFVCLKGRARGNRMTPAGLRSLFRHHRQTTGVMKANPHRFRHTFASDMIRVGISLPALMQLMGHAQIQTTLVYVQVTPQDVWEHARAVAQHIPPVPPPSPQLRIPLPTHPLMKFFPGSGISDDFKSDASVTYRGTVRHFLTYLGAEYPEAPLSISCAAIPTSSVGWSLRSQNPPLAAITRANHVIYLRRCWKNSSRTQQLRPVHLLGRDDVPRKEHHLPRPLTPEQDQLIQRITAPEHLERPVTSPSHRHAHRRMCRSLR